MDIALDKVCELILRAREYDVKEGLTDPDSGSNPTDDGSTSRSLHGVSTLVPAWHRGWTDDIYAASLRAGRAVQKAVLAATGAANRGVVQRSDLTGFNWADVPAVLIETGFMTNPAESSRLHTPAYQQQVALGLTRGVAAFVAP